MLFVVTYDNIVILWCRGFIVVNNTTFNTYISFVNVNCSVITYIFNIVTMLTTCCFR